MLELLRSSEVPLEVLEVRAQTEETRRGAVRFESLHLRTDRIDGRDVVMNAYFACPQGRTDAAPMLYIPGGRGITKPNVIKWAADECGIAILGVDWLGCGGSSPVGDLNPAPLGDAIVFRGEDFRSSFQFHNARALLFALDMLCARDEVDASQLAVGGGSWGGFYSWFLGGIDPRIRYLFPTFGCGFYDLDLRYIWRIGFRSMGPEKTEDWLRAFDPGRRADRITAEVYYETATNDKFFSMPSAMKTFDRVRSKKHLLLVHNEDHFTRPYNTQAFRSLRNVLEGNHGKAANWSPIEFRSVEWIENSARVRVDTDVSDVDVFVVYSAGGYTQSFGRFWRRVPARRKGGAWIANLPIVDPAREVWFYAHAERRGARFANSSGIRSIVPDESGLKEATAEFEPLYAIPPEPFYSLPVGDKIAPRATTSQEQGHTVLSWHFEPAAVSGAKGVLYHLEGDLIAARGYDALDVVLRVPGNREIDELHLLLVTDYHAVEERTYGVRLSDLAGDFTSFQRCVVPFERFEPIATRPGFLQPTPAAPLAVERLCGVGVYRGTSQQPTEVQLLRSGVTRADENVVESFNGMSTPYPTGVPTAGKEGLGNEPSYPAGDSERCLPR